MFPENSNQFFFSKDIANFHRPKALWYPHDNEVALKEQGKLLAQGPMKIILKSLGGKGSKLHVDAEETISSVKAKASKKLGACLPYACYFSSFNACPCCLHNVSIVSLFVSSFIHYAIIVLE